MKTGGRPAPPRCALGAVQVEEFDVEGMKEEAWNKHGTLVVRIDDPRLGWIEQKVISDIGRKLYEKGGRHV